jgi:hypothetical protein
LRARGKLQGLAVSKQFDSGACNLKVGNDRGRLVDVLTQLLPFIGDPRTLNDLRAVEDVTAS